jgi:hypothetical protein
MMHHKKNTGQSKSDVPGQSIKKTISGPKPAQKIQTAEGWKRDKLREKQAPKIEE